MNDLAHSTIHETCNTESMCTYDFCQLSFADIDDILKIEQQVYSHPWTRGNFLDSLYSAYDIAGLRNRNQQLMGYFVLMPVLDEMHLLNIAVAEPLQGNGYARILLDNIYTRVRQRKFLSILLEVRISNLRAIEVYQRAGFTEVGRRKAYYPVAENQREDAIVMRMEL
ncbi:ribosomal protein S18-alanine N-acetyltransferase [soil metagenome]